MSAALALQEAVYNTLINDTSLSAKVSSVYDGFPDQQKNTVKFPFISLGDTNSVPFTHFEHMGEEIYMSIHIWSRYKGFKEGQDIAGDVQRLFAQQEIEVTGFGTVPCFFETADTIRDSDGITRQLQLRYRFKIQY